MSKVKPLSHTEITHLISTPLPADGQIDVYCTALTHSYHGILTTIGDIMNDMAHSIPLIPVPNQTCSKIKQLEKVMDKYQTCLDMVQVITSDTRDALYRSIQRSQSSPKSVPNEQEEKQEQEQEEEDVMVVEPTHKQTATTTTTGTVSPATDTHQPTPSPSMSNMDQMDSLFFQDQNDGDNDDDDNGGGDFSSMLIDLNQDKLPSPPQPPPQPSSTTAPNTSSNVDFQDFLSLNFDNMDPTKQPPPPPQESLQQQQQQQQQDDSNTDNNDDIDMSLFDFNLAE